MAIVVVFWVYNFLAFLQMHQQQLKLQQQQQLVS